MTDTKNEKSPEFEGFFHLRTKTGLEVLGQLYYVQDDIPVLYFPLRVMYNISETLSVRYTPLTLFSDDEFFTFSHTDIEFLLELNDRSKERYLSYLEEYHSVKTELDDEYNTELDKLTDPIPEGTKFH
jgi:hypothetical protein